MTIQIHEKDSARKSTAFVYDDYAPTFIGAVEAVLKSGVKPMVMSFPWVEGFTEKYPLHRIETIIRSKNLISIVLSK